jgi:hypothetical protein
MNNIPQGSLKILETFADGQKRDVRDGSVFDVEQVKWLYKENFLTSMDASNLDGPAFLNVSITSKGMELLQQKQMELLQQKQKEVMERPNRESAYEKNYPMRSKVVIVVAAGLLMAAITAIFTWLFH